MSLSRTRRLSSLHYVLLWAFSLGHASGAFGVTAAVVTVADFQCR